MAKHFKPEKKPGFLRKFFGFLGKLLLVIVLLAAGMIGYLSATEYKPDDVADLSVEGDEGVSLMEGDTISIMTWNTGYGALGDNADFFMDGGEMVSTADEDRVRSNMEGIASEIEALDPDVIFLQETDRDSSRSYHIDEYEWLSGRLGKISSFANNFKVAYLPYPIPPIGKVDSGIATFSSYPVDSAARIQLPIPFKWPVRMANLKRCAMVTSIPVEGTDKKLVLVNLHLEAYDDGEGKARQTAMLAEILEREAESGNYVIAGGDFNQIFSSEDASLYPAQEGKWEAGELDVSKFSDGWQFMMDETVPSCRSLDQPYAGADKDGFQYYLIDGFIVSGNIKVNSCEGKDLGFVVSDHNPVLMNVTIGEKNEAEGSN